MFVFKFSSNQIPFIKHPHDDDIGCYNKFFTEEEAKYIRQKYPKILLFSELDIRYKMLASWWNFQDRYMKIIEGINTLPSHDLLKLDDQNLWRKYIHIQWRALVTSPLHKRQLRTKYIYLFIVCMFIIHNNSYDLTEEQIEIANQLHDIYENKDNDTWDYWYNEFEKEFIIKETNFNLDL